MHTDLDTPKIKKEWVHPKYPTNRCFRIILQLIVCQQSFQDTHCVQKSKWRHHCTPRTQYHAPRSPSAFWEIWGLIQLSLVLMCTRPLPIDDIRRYLLRTSWWIAVVHLLLFFFFALLLLLLQFSVHSRHLVFENFQMPFCHIPLYDIA